MVEQPWISEIDINPLLASPERLLALDARVVVHPAETHPDHLPRPAVRPYPSQYVCGSVPALECATMDFSTSCRTCSAAYFLRPGGGRALDTQPRDLRSSAQAKAKAPLARRCGSRCRASRGACRDDTRMRILGPIFRFELVRIARRQRLTTSRCLFALALSLVAAAVYITAYKEAPLPLTLHDIARITEGLCYGFLGILFAVAVIFTPQWTADAIASEKERRTLPFLLLTDLTSHEIILGKLGSRLVQIGFFVLAALPVLVGLQFFGGVEPALILVAVAALGATMWSLGSLTMVASVYARTSRIAGAAGRPGVRTLHRRHDDGGPASQGVSIDRPLAGNTL